jgi:hypothetical protein
MSIWLARRIVLFCLTVCPFGWHKRRRSIWKHHQILKYAISRSPLYDFKRLAMMRMTGALNPYFGRSFDMGSITT